MKAGYLIGAAVAGLGFLNATPSLAQPPPPPPVVAETGVTSYPPSFFDEFHPTSALSMVTTIPGFSFDSGGFARGQSVNAGNVLIDGRRPPAGNDNISSVLGRIPAESVERIDVIRGGAPGIDMMGKPMVANVIRKQTTSVSGAVNGSAGGDPNGGRNYGLSINATRQNGDRTLDGSASGNSQTGISEGTSTRVSPLGVVLQEAVNTGEYSFESIGANTAYERPLFGGNVRVNGQYGWNSNSNDFRTLLVVPGGEQLSVGTGTGQNAEFGARYTYDFDSGRKLEAVFLQQWDTNSGDSTFEIPGISSTSASEGRHAQSVITGSIALPRRGKWTFDGGIEGAYNWFENNSAYVVDGTPVFIPGDAITSTEVRAEAFGSANWSPTPKLSGQFAFRYEHSSMNRETSAGDADLVLEYLKPRINLSWRPKAGHEISGTLQRAVSQLGPGDFAVSSNIETGTGTVSNPFLEPEKAWTLDGRYLRTWGRRGNFTAQYNFRLIENPTATEFVNSTSDHRINIPAARYHQVRLSANVPLEPFGLKDNYLSAGVSFRESARLDPTTGESGRASGEAPYDWNFGYSQERNQGKFIWRVNLSGRPQTESFGVRSLGFSTSSLSANASITWRPTPKVIFSASAFSSLRDSEGHSQLFLGKRTDNILRYTTTSHSDAVPSFSMSLRRSF